MHRVIKYLQSKWRVLTRAKRWPVYSNLICIQTDYWNLSWWIHTPVCPDSICNRVTPAIRFVIMAALIISSFSLFKIPCQSVMQLRVSAELTVKGIIIIFFLKLSQSRATLDLCPSGCQFFYSSRLLHTESRWSWLRAEMNLVYVTVFLVGHSANSVHTWIPLPAFTFTMHNILLLFMSQPDLYICCSCALISHPRVSFLIRISLAATEGNKMLLLWKPLPERQFMRLPACRQKPIYGPFLSEHPQMGPALYEHGAFNQTDGGRDRVKKRQQQIERKMDGVLTDD